MPRIDEQLVGRRGLHHLAAVHHHDPVAHVAHQRQVVRDVQVGEAVLGLQTGEEVEDLTAGRHVERGHGFVGDDDLGPGRQGAGDGDAWRWPPDSSIGRRPAMSARRPTSSSSSATRARYRDARPPSRSTSGSAMISPTDIIGSRLFAGILEDELHVVLRDRRGGDELVADADALVARVGPFEADEHTRQRGLARSRLADDSHRLAFAHHQVDAVDCDGAGAGGAAPVPRWKVLTMPVRAATGSSIAPTAEGDGHLVEHQLRRRISPP